MISRTFLKGHNKQGYPTLFVEKIMAGLADINPDFKMRKDFVLYDYQEYYTCREPKFHTIRKGNRFKPGDMASLRVWGGKPYRSNQAEFALVEIKKTWDVELALEIGAIKINGGEWIFIESQIEEMAMNDGLILSDFKAWFTEPFKGQIICWNNEVEYPSRLEKPSA